MNTEPVPPRPEAANPCEIKPLGEPVTIWSIAAALLKQPGAVLHELLHGRAGSVLAALATLAAVALALYGVVVGSLSAGGQLWIAPAKIVTGSLAAALICLPSLFVFLCLNGANARLRPVLGLMLAAIGLMAILLASFCPIAWVFSQSTDSVPFMAGLHLILWIVAALFGLRLLINAAAALWGKTSGRLGLWAAIYLVVCLQMMTALRPIVGSSPDILPTEKQFFLAHWWETFSGDPR